MICPYYVLCDDEQPGTCDLAVTGCCDNTGKCTDGYHCTDMNTCLADLTPPDCWNDADCPTGTCQGAMLCSCDMDCMSVAGTCRPAN